MNSCRSSSGTHPLSYLYALIYNAPTPFSCQKVTHSASRSANHPGATSIDHHVDLNSSGIFKSRGITAELTGPRRYRAACAGPNDDAKLAARGSGPTICSTAPLSAKANVVKRAFESVQNVNVETRGVDFELVLVVAHIRNTQGHSVPQFCVREKPFLRNNHELHLRLPIVDYHIGAAVRRLIRFSTRHVWPVSVIEIRFVVSSAESSDYAPVTRQTMMPQMRWRVERNMSDMHLSPTLGNRLLRGS